MKISDAERSAGVRANYRVYYRRNGKLYFDAVWKQTAAEAEAFVKAAARELRWKIDIVRVDAIPAADA